MDTTDADERRDLMDLIQGLVAAANQVTEAFVAVQGMHATDVEALMRVLDAEGRAASMTLGDLGRGLGLSSGAVTALVDRLERADVLHRVRDRHDRRRVFLEVRPEGHAIADRYVSPVEQRTEEVLHQFDHDQLQVVRRFLELTTGAMDDQHAALVAEQGEGTRADG